MNENFDLEQNNGEQPVAQSDAPEANAAEQNGGESADQAGTAEQVEQAEPIEQAEPSEPTEQTEQTGERQAERENYQRTSGFAENLSNDLNFGLHSLLYRRISNLTIRDSVIKNAFEAFVNSAEIGDSFSVSDIIFGCESVIKGYEPEAVAGSGIYCVGGFGSGKAFTKLAKYSVGGIYALLGIRNGIEVDLEAFGGSIAAGETKRFAILSERRAEKLMRAAAKEGVQVARVGSVLADNLLVVRRGGEMLTSFDKSYAYPQERISVSIDETNRIDFLSGYRAACSYASCRSVSANNAIRFGLGGDMAGICARALGYFAAMHYLKAIPVNMVFTPDRGCTVAVPRPSVADGDYLYLLKVRTDLDGLPEKIHHGQLNYYLSEMTKRKVIKYVLPVKENAASTIQRLCGGGLEYVPLSEIPEKCFGVIVCVGRGNSVNGIRLGCFKNTEESHRSPEE